MNRPNSSNGGAAWPPGPNPGESIQWTKEDPDQYSGGLIRVGYSGDAGFDLAASRTVLVPANGFAKIPTNVRVALPPGYFALLIGRSSTFFKRQLLVQTAVIDGGFRGEMWFVLRNMSDQDVIVRKKERIAQLVLHALHVPSVVEVQELPQSERGVAGFGSTDSIGEVL